MASSSSSRRPEVAGSAIAPAALPLVAPHHRLYLLILLVPLALFTFASVFLSTHTYNVFLSALPNIDDIPSSAKPVASLFAQRTNVINRYFIKYAWAWTSLAWLAQVLTLRAQPDAPSSTSTAHKRSDSIKGKARMEDGQADGITTTEPSVPVKTPADQAATIASPLSKSILRYAIATACWFAFTSWLFGPPLMERIFTSSGGICLPQHPPTTHSTSNPSGPASSAGFKMPEMPIDPDFCRAGRKGVSREDRPELFRTAHTLVVDGLESGRLRGVWRGGHDVSGHTFILILSSLFLLEELSPYLAQYLLAILPSNISSSLPLNTLFPRGTIRSSRNPYREESATAQRNSLAVTTSVLALVTLWVFSIVNTSLFFHTPQEKISGALIALAAWLVLPKGN